MIFQRIFKKLFQRSRLDYYKSIIRLALQNDYIVTSLADWYENNFYEGRKVLVLRHDVDLLPVTAYKMFLIERELGVKSTFYFRWLTMDSRVVNHIKAERFEVSLHYETLASYARVKNIFKADQIGQADIQQCVNRLKKEINRFEEKFDKIKTLCSHGDKRNRVLGIPNHKILENVNRDELGIYFETYDQDILSRFDVYLSDSSINENHKWKYGKTPETAISEGAKCICLLTHPHHWVYSIPINICKIYKELTGQV